MTRIDLILAIVGTALAAITLVCVSFVTSYFLMYPLN